MTFTLRKTSARVGFAAGVVLILTGLSPALSAQPAATIYYVATSGLDTNPGTSAAPFKTIQKCATTAVAGDTCMINGGTYRETVKPTNSGTAGNPITFTSAAGAIVKIDGTDAVSGWTLDTGNVYTTSVVLSGTSAAPYSSTEYPSNSDLWANQVFAGASMVPEAAYPAPSANPFTQTYVTSGASTTRSASGDCDTPPCTTTLTGTLTYNSFPAFGDLTGVQAYFTGGWVALSAKVSSGTLTASNHTLNISFPQSDDNVYPGGGNAKNFRLVGSKAFLTGAGQWYYDPGARQLYMWATGGGTPSNVFVKKRNYSFDLNSRSYINVRGITTFANSITTNDSSSNVVIDGLSASYLSHWQTAQYVTSLPLAGIYDANHRYDSGILLHGTNNTLKNSTILFSSGNGVNLKGTGHSVINNYIHDVSYNGTYTAAVTLEVGSANDTITNNSLYNTGRDVINMNTNLYPNAGYHNIDIGYNDMSGYAKLSYDLGGIYACCDTSLSGSRIHHNRIHDPANTGNGIHLDNGAFDVTIDHNLIYNLNGTGDINHGGNGINFGGHSNKPPAGSSIPYLTGKILNNTIVAGDNYTIFNYFANASHVANTQVKNNILDGASPAGQTYGYISGGTPQSATNLVTKRSADGTGTDPLYSASASGNYSLQTGSPAVNGGTVIPGITDGYTGSAPDVGAFEGSTTWAAGCNLAGCPATPGGGAGPTNVALGKPATAYYTASAATRKPANAVDGVYANASNGWYSDGATAGSFSDGDAASTSGSLCSWLYIDLGQNYQIISYRIQFGETTVAGMWDAPYQIQTLTAANALSHTVDARNSSVCTRRTGGNFGSIASGSTGSGTPFVVSASTDIWTTVATSTGTNVATTYTLSSPATARYVRILTNEPTTAHRYGVDVIELEVFGTP